MKRRVSLKDLSTARQRSVVAEEEGAAPLAMAISAAFITL